jgi:hypothetical protein
MSGAVPEIRDRAILAGWIAGLLIAIVLLWVFTRPLQERYLLRTVNRVFVAAGDSRRLSGGMTRPAGKSSMLGYWYSMLNSTDRIFVFGAIQDGILIPCGAVVSANGEVREIIPLSAHAGQVLENMPENVMRIYVRRIEAAVLPTDGRSSRSFSGEIRR